jgi:hypothetical protein
MQANTITLAVDVANNNTPVNKEYVRTEELVNRSTYRGPGSTMASRNVLQFYRTFPKRSGNFLGATKTSVKFTQDIVVPSADGSGNITVPMLVSAEYSIPVGATSAQVLALRQHLVTICDRDDIMGTLNEHADI